MAEDTTETTDTTSSTDTATESTSSDTTTESSETTASLLGDKGKDDADGGSLLGGGGDKKGDKEASAMTAPEQYEAFTLPDGMTMADDVFTELSAIGKDRNMDQATAQKLVDMGTKVAQDAIAGHVAAQKETADKWVADSKALPDIGGDNLKDTLSVAAKAIDTYGSDDLRSALDATGMGSHPEMIKFMHAVGKTLAEGTFIAGQNSEDDSEEAKLARRYDNTPQS